MTSAAHDDRLIELFFFAGPRVVGAARRWLAAEEGNGRWPWPDDRPALMHSDAEVLDAISQSYHPIGIPGGLWRFVDDFYANRLLIDSGQRKGLAS